MQAMQYTVTLPSDYDMATIRRRVATTGHLMDGFAGLEFKAYLIQEKSQGAPRNAYAPFYVWHSIDGMRAFCWGEPGYSSIVRDFGRHPIHDWTVAQLARGPAEYADAQSLSMHVTPLPDRAAPSACLAPTIQPYIQGISPTTVVRLAAVDLATWTVALVELSSQPAEQGAAGTGTTSYEVLHVSAPDPAHEQRTLAPVQ